MPHKTEDLHKKDFNELILKYTEFTPELTRVIVGAINMEQVDLCAVEPINWKTWELHSHVENMKKKIVKPTMNLFSSLMKLFAMKIQPHPQERHLKYLCQRIHTIANYISINAANFITNKFSNKAFNFLCNNHLKWQFFKSDFGW